MPRCPIVSAFVLSACLPACTDIVNPNCADNSGGEFSGYAAVLRVTAANGAPAALGTTVRLTGSGIDEAITGRSPEDSIIAIGRDPGRFTIGIDRPWWGSRVIDDVEVQPPAHHCDSIDPVTFDVVLQLEPGAPPVRQVVPERDHIHVKSNPPFTVSGGSGETQLQAYVEADPGIPTGIGWTALDPGIASVTADGILTVRCRESPIDTRIVAHSVEDPAVRDTILVTVLRTELWECPASSGA